VASLLAKFFGRTASEGAAYALGVATGPVLAPAVEELKNQAWREASTKAVDPGGAAEIVAEDVQRRDWGANEAAAHGIDGSRFDAIVGAVLNGPGFGELIRILRRHPNGGPDFEHGLRKAKLETRWDDLLADLANERLDPAVIANAIQQGFMHDAGVLPVTPDQTPGKVVTEPPVDIDTLAEAAAGGYDPDRLTVLARLAGLPPGPEALASMVFRNIVEAQDYSRGVGQGHTKNEWADAILEYSRQIPSVTDYVQAHLKGWIDAPAMYAGTARHGMTKADTDLTYLRSGRPAAPGQMATAVARGIDGPDGSPMDRQQFLKGIAESDIRPEWGPMLYDSRYLYPPLFQLTRLVQAGAVTADTAAEWATFDRYPPAVVNALHTYWTQSKTEQTVSTPARLATTQARAALHKRFLVDRIDSAGVLSGLELLGSDPAEAGHILEMWTLEKGWLVKPLTPSQIKKLYTQGTITIDEATLALEELHMSEGDATSYLQQ
jgi:hypothetical protein